MTTLKRNDPLCDDDATESNDDSLGLLDEPYTEDITSLSPNKYVPSSSFLASITNQNEDEKRKQNNNNDKDKHMKENNDTGLVSVVRIDNTTKTTPSSNNSLIPTSKIHGIGLWNSWTRNFASPLLAVWDLLDNALDAACPTTGKVHVDLDMVPTQGQMKSYASGIVIRNSSERRIKSLSFVLKAYTSSKVHSSHAIGENGVGIKQGCATLTDLSFVLTRNENVFELGILALELQSEEGIYLPSFTFELDPESMNDLEVVRRTMQQHLLNLQKTKPSLARVFAIYGGWFPTSRESKAELPFLFVAKGAGRLAFHCVAMTDTEKNGAWGNDDHVFFLILHQLKHAPGYQQEYTEANVDITTMNKRYMQSEFAHRASSFLDQIAEALPKQYIHIMASFDVKVNQKRIVFCYWPRRLAELTKFCVTIDERVPYKPCKEAPTAEDHEHADMSHNSKYLLTLYVGFDPIECCEGLTTARLLWYSRQSGRLIKEEKDGRGELKLTNSGSKYCQGLVIIVDDDHGHLPLNPTKQDVAFGEQSHGETHKANLMMWIAAIAKVYWKHHLSGSNNSLTTLTDRVLGTVTQAKKYVTKDRTHLFGGKPIGQCEFTTFQNMTFNTLNTNLSLYAEKGYAIVPGQHTVIRLPPVSSAVGTAPLNDRRLAAAGFRKVRSKSTRKGRKAVPAANPRPSKQARMDDSDDPDSEINQQRRRLYIKKLKKNLKQSERENEELKASIKDADLNQVESPSLGLSNQELKKQLFALREEMRDKVAKLKQITAESVAREKEVASAEAQYKRIERVNMQLREDRKSLQQGKSGGHGHL